MLTGKNKSNYQISYIYKALGAGSLERHSRERAPILQERGRSALLFLEKERRQERAPEIRGTSALPAPRSF